MFYKYAVKYFHQGRPADYERFGTLEEAKARAEARVAYALHVQVLEWVDKGSDSAWRVVHACCTP